MRRFLAPGILAVLAGCAATAEIPAETDGAEQARPKSPPPSARLPALEPWLRRDLYRVIATENPDLNGTIEVIEAAQGRCQTRVALRVKAEQLQDLVLEAQYQDEQIKSFRLLKREDGEDEEVRGVLEGPELVVRWSGEEVRIPWSEDRRFDGPRPRDFIATGFKPGRSFSLEIYDPSWDRKRCLTRSYVMGDAKAYVTPLGETLEAFNVEVNVPHPGSPPQIHLLLVDRQGRILQRTQLLPRVTVRTNAIIISLIERSGAPG